MNNPEFPDTSPTANYPFNQLYYSQSQPILLQSNLYKRKYTSYNQISYRKSLSTEAKNGPTVNHTKEL